MYARMETKHVKKITYCPCVVAASSDPSLPFCRGLSVDVGKIYIEYG